MKHQIKAWFSDQAIFESDLPDDTPSNDVTRALMEKAVGVGAYLGGADLWGADLRGASLHGANLQEADLRGADLRGADLRGASLRGADLQEANLRGADLLGADLRGASLQGADLQETDLLGADLWAADLRGANLWEANLRDGVKLTGSRPLLQVGPIGSRGDTLMCWSTDGGLLLQTGCFFGTRDEFVSALTRDHAGSPHEREYLAALALADVHFDTWKEAA